jgi:hypothetical protein
VSPRKVGRNRQWSRAGFLILGEEGKNSGLGPKGKYGVVRHAGGDRPMPRNLIACDMCVSAAAPMRVMKPRRSAHGACSYALSLPASLLSDAD